LRRVKGSTAKFAKKSREEREEKLQGKRTMISGRTFSITFLNVR